MLFPSEAKPVTEGAATEPDPVPPTSSSEPGPMSLTGPLNRTLIVLTLAQGSAVSWLAPVCKAKPSDVLLATWPAVLWLAR